jgi:hypothetical protein
VDPPSRYVWTPLFTTPESAYSRRYKRLSQTRDEFRSICQIHVPGPRKGAASGSLDQQMLNSNYMLGHLKVIYLHIHQIYQTLLISRPYLCRSATHKIRTRHCAHAQKSQTLPIS